MIRLMKSIMHCIQRGKQMRFNKLVRDNMPEVIATDPKVDNISIGSVHSKKELYRYIAKKIVEDANKLSSEIQKDRIDNLDTLEAFSDLKCIMNKLKDEMKWSADDIDHAYKKKANSCGEYKTNCILLEVLSDAERKEAKEHERSKGLLGRI